jgi:hypothetical protein
MLKQQAKQEISKKTRKNDIYLLSSCWLVKLFLT